MVIKKVMPVRAFQLGTVCAAAQALMDAGLLIQMPEGLWRVRTRETEAEGELARTGDYVKLDSIGMPYPTKKEWFEANHKQHDDGLYLQITTPRKAWSAAEQMIPEIRFLLDRGLLHWDRETGFGAHLWGAWQTAGADAVIVLDQVQADAMGELRQVEFHFVAAEEFAVTYEILPE